MNIPLNQILQRRFLTSVGIRVLSIALKAVQLLFLVRLYGAGTFGIYAIALGVFTFAMVFARLGLDHFSLREATSASNAEFGRLIRISRFMALPGLVVAFLAQLFVWHFYAWDVAVMFAIFLVAAPFYAISWNHIFILRGSGRIDLSMVIFEILNPIVMMFGALLLRGNELGLALAFLGATLSTLFLTSYFLRRASESSDSNAEEPTAIRNSIVQSRSFFASSIFEAAQTLADGLFVGYFLRPFDAALYAIITRMSGLVLMPIAILTIYMKNMVAKFRQEPLATIWHRLRIYTFVSVAVSLALWAALVTITPWIGALFEVAFPVAAQWAYVAVVTARALQGATGSVTQSLFMSGRERYVALTNLILLVPYLGSLFAFGPTFGLLGVGLVVLGNSLISGAILIFLLMTEIQRHPRPLVTV
jgi:O-antigen/teichoic acid export membrane protein